MAGPSDDAFARARSKFTKSIGPHLAQQFSGCTLKDVRDAIRDIQREHGEEDNLRNMRRLSAFIEAMEQFGKVVDVFLNASEFVCFVWGPIKFLLGIAKTHIDSFENLLDAYSDIGDVIPGLMHYRTTFEKHPPLATVLEDYYSDILRFHSEAIVVFRRPRWKKFFHATWKTFDTQFSPILQSLERRRQLIDGEKSSATLYEIEKVREEIEAVRTAQREQAEAGDLEKHQMRLAQIKQKLQFANYQLDQEISTEDRSGSNSGQWIFEDPRFLTWKDLEEGGNQVLFIHGKPGAGKTTLVSSIVEKLLAERSNSLKNSPHSELALAYFYFKHGQDDKNTLNGMLRAFLEQLIDQDLGVSRHFHELINTMSGVNLRSTKTLEGLVQTCLEGYRATYLILDGLDECADGEALKTIEWVLSLVSHQHEPTDTTAKIRIALAGQHDGVMDIPLASHPSISLDHAGHRQDIHSYTETFVHKIQEKFNLSANLKEEIVSLVLKEAEGMFLFARVVLDNLFRQTRLSRLKQEILPGVFPKGLEKAYDRVVARILDESSDSEREDALKVLGLVACANRVLFWREIQAFFCIDPLETRVNHDNRLLVSCKALCGSLLDTHRPADRSSGLDDLVQMVHQTARLYLLRKRLDAFEENMKLSKFCIQYLTSTPFQATSTQEIEGQALEGYYALQEYCVQYWCHHLHECVQRVPQSRQEDLDRLVSLARTFMVSYRATSEDSAKVCLADLNSTIKTIRDLPLDIRVLSGLFDFTTSIVRVREVIEALRPTTGNSFVGSPAEQHPTNLQGTHATFKCHKPWCDFFTDGFPTLQEQRRHMDFHDFPFCCPVEGCFAETIGFDSEIKLSEHRKNYHTNADDEIKFPALGTKRPLTLCAAVERGDLTTVVDLLDAGADINDTSRSKGKLSPLTHAVRAGNLEVVKVLLARGADINFGGLKSQPPLWHAVHSGNVDIFNFLRTHPQVETTQSQVAFWAADSGHVDIVRVVTMLGYDTGDKSDLLAQACRVSHPEVVRYLLRNGYDNFVTEMCLLQSLRAYCLERKLQGNVVLEALLATGKVEIREKSEEVIWATLQYCHNPPALEMILSYPKLFIQWTKLDGYRNQVMYEGWDRAVAIFTEFVALREQARELIKTYDEAVRRGDALDDVAFAIFKVTTENAGTEHLVEWARTLTFNKQSPCRRELEHFVALVNDAKGTISEWGYKGDGLHKDFVKFVRS
ncbi:hypothetical protein QBC42DRAFT_335816 [Cladorrhinum samala]|uniref:NACHT domain-containing protein n=1 Tax=Cladorrhinum samala TaxID=585594 RepID=A0AAV9I069_9PEZI|nr:hypothetical protein QBC42DRAFT_335816 [Cladorrhinum samala]